MSEKIEYARRSDANSPLEEPISKPVPRRSAPPVHDLADAGGQFSQDIRNRLSIPRYLSCPRISPPLKFSLCTLT